MMMMMMMMTGCDSWIWVTRVVEEALKKVAPGSGLAGRAARVCVRVCVLSCAQLFRARLARCLLQSNNGNNK